MNTVSPKFDAPRPVHGINCTYAYAEFHDKPLQTYSRHFISIEPFSMLGPQMSYCFLNYFVFLPNTGSGKTTLLNVISGRLKPDSGSVTLNGVEFTKRERRRMAFVQQQDVFFTHLTVWETIYVSLHVYFKKYSNFSYRFANLW